VVRLTQVKLLSLSIVCAEPSDKAAFVSTPSPIFYTLTAGRLTPAGEADGIKARMPEFSARAESLSMIVAEILLI